MIVKISPTTANTTYLKQNNLPNSTNLRNTTIQHHTNHSHKQLKPDFAKANPVHPCRFIMAPKKADLLEQLRGLGEVVPEKWTIPQIKARLAELKEEGKGSAESSLKGKLQKLHQASKNKGTLMEHLKDLGIPVSSNKTIAQMVALGEEETHALFEPEDQEYVGFGKFGDKTYLEVWTENPSYASWVLTTNQESDSPHWRLRRMARWLQMKKHQQAVKMTPTSPKKPSETAESSVGSFSLVDSKGYPEDKTSPTKSQMMQDLEELEQMRQALKDKIHSVAQQEAALQIEKAEMSHTEGRHKNRKEM